MDTRKPIDSLAIVMMVVICLTWSFQQIALKYTGADAGPVLQIAARSGIAAFCVYCLIRFRGERLEIFSRRALLGALAGLFFTVEFFLLGEAIRLTSASHVVVFLYTAPIFAGIGLHWKLPSERLAPVQWAGILLAAGGIAFAFLGASSPAPAATLSAPSLLGDLAALLAAFCWGATTVLIRTTRLSAVPAGHMLFYQLATAFVLLALAAWAVGQTTVVFSPLMVANVLFQGIVVSFLSFLGWFWLLTQYRASQLGVFSFMTPFFGVLLGIILLDEPLTLEFALGATAVLIGIMLVSAAPWLRQRAERRVAG